MRDIARAAGVSQSTVSRVLSDSASSVAISPQTRERVLAVAQTLGFRPNPLARALRGAPTMLLGVIVRDIMDPFFAAAVEAVTAAAGKRAYNVVLGQAHGEAEQAIALRSVLETRHVDAMLILGDMRHQPRLIDDLTTSAVPAVALWQGSSLPGIPTVNVDNRGGMLAALEHLGSFGHTRIGLISGRSLGDIQARRAAYLGYVSERGAAIAELVRTVPNELAGGARAMESLLQLREPPTAVMATTDVLALGALHAAHLARLSVPGDVSVVGFDDIPMAAFAVPALTTVRMPIVEMAEVAVRLAIDEPAGVSDAAQLPDHVVAPVLIERASVGPPRTAGRMLPPAE